MKRLVFPALFTMLLLAVAAPICFAAENSAGDQQTVTQFSKLPPVQLPSIPRAQGEYFQVSLLPVQQGAKQPELQKTDDWIGMTTAIGTIISSIAAIITAIAVPIITLEISKKTIMQTALSLEKDFKRRTLEQEVSFKFQRDQILFEEKKRVMLNFYVSTSQPAVKDEKFDINNLEIQLAVIKMMMDSDFYQAAEKLYKFLKELLSLSFDRSRLFDNIDRRRIHEALYANLATEIKRVLSGEDSTSLLTASN